MPKLSIIVPVYKVEPYLKKCVESIIKQTFSDWELLLIDDGSPDSCSEICDSYATHDKRIRVLHQTNFGVSRARNCGLDMCTGDWVSFIDSDDFLQLETFREVFSVIEKENPDIVTIDFAYVDEQDNIVKPREYGEDRLFSKEDFVGAQFDIPISIRCAVSNKIIRRSCIGSLRFDDTIHASEDTLMLHQCLKNINSAYWIRRPFYRNVQRQGSAMHGALKLKDFAKSLEIHRLIYQETKKHYPHLTDKALAFYVDTCAWKMRSQKADVSELKGEEYREAKKILRWMKNRILKEWVSIIVCKEMSFKQKVVYLLIGVFR